MSEEKLNDKFGDTDPDKDFGLPKVEITPIQTAEAKNESVEVPKEGVVGKGRKPISLQTSPETVSGHKNTKAEKKRGFGWLVLLLIFFVFAFGGWYYTQQEVKVNKNPETKPVAEKPVPVVPEPEIVPEEKVEEYSLTEITSRGERPRYFVVVGSFIDEDMAKDHSQALNAKGMNTFLVYPYGEIVYYRLAIGQYETFALALEEINRVKDGFKENLWALKY